MMNRQLAKQHREHPEHPVTTADAWRTSRDHALAALDRLLETNDRERAEREATPAR